MSGNPQSLLAKYAPRSLSELAGHPDAVNQLQSFAEDPFPNAFIFHGPTGVGKTAAAKALAADLGCDMDNEELGGITEIPSGKQDGKAVTDSLRAMALRPLFGSGWKTLVINEADCMTTQAEAIWLDGLENLPPRTVVVFTTNELHRLSKRLIGRCEVVEFSGDSPELVAGMHKHIRKIWKAETGREVGRLPENLGKYDAESTTYSVRLAVQQIAPLIRTNARSAATIRTPLARTAQVVEAEKWKEAGRKAAETKKRNQSRKAAS